MHDAARTISKCKFQFTIGIHVVTVIARCTVETVGNRAKVHRVNIVEHQISVKKVPYAIFPPWLLQSQKCIEKTHQKKVVLRVFFRSVLTPKLEQLEKCHQELFCRKFLPLRDWACGLLLHLQSFPRYKRSKSRPSATSKNRKLKKQKPPIKTTFRDFPTCFTTRNSSLHFQQ